MRKILLTIVSIGAFLILLINLYMLIYTRPYRIAASQIPVGNNVLLVLGTNPITRRGNPNPFYTGRIKTVASVDATEQISTIILSGDGASPEYDETEAMRQDLLNLGISSGQIITDPGGTRTIYSIDNSSRILSDRSLIIVSQDFHLIRAIYIARKSGVDAYGIAAPKVSGRIGRSVLLREIVARGYTFFEVLLR